MVGSSLAIEINTGLINSCQPLLFPLTVWLELHLFVQVTLSLRDAEPAQLGFITRVRMCPFSHWKLSASKQTVSSVKAEPFIHRTMNKLTPHYSHSANAVGGAIMWSSSSLFLSFFCSFHRIKNLFKVLYWKLKSLLSSSWCLGAERSSTSNGCKRRYSFVYSVFRYAETK